MTSLFLAENLKSRERHAQETTAFLRQESEKLGKHLEVLEKKIATFKEKADGALPELMQLNMQLLNQADRELAEIDRQLSAAEERKIYLQGELATLKPQTPMITASGERILDSHEQLKALQAQYISMASYLSSEHPDIVKIKEEIDALQKSVGPEQGRDELAKKLEDERAKLTKLFKRYGAEHPDVQQSQRVVFSLEQELRANPQRFTPITSIKAENPAFINIEAQLQSTLSSIQAYKKARGELKKRTKTYAERLERSPRLEPEYLDLVRDRDNSALKYQEIRSRLLEAQVSEGLEAQRKGERFTLIDPPALPEKPEKPNRPAIIFLGFLVAVTCGVGLGGVREMFDHSLRSPDMIRRITNLSPLAIIPYLPNQHDMTQQSRTKWSIWMSGILCVIGILVFLHYVWMPLDVIWFSIFRKL